MNKPLIWKSQNSDVFYEQIVSIINSVLISELSSELNSDLNCHQKAVEPFLIAIDGNCGSGKSTLARFLQQHYDCNLFHMDDFYLPWALKTPERLIEPGGNVYYERFQTEVLIPLIQGHPFSYQAYDCKLEALMTPQKVVPKRINIIEGSYSMHPKLIDSYHLKLFLSISEADQNARILERNGEESLMRFQTLWIPLENKYFEGYKVSESADWIIDVKG